MNLEWEILFRAQRGDDAACRALLDQYQSRLTALAILITGSPAVADDIVQETIVRALDARIKNTSGAVLGYLATIAYRLAVKESRRGKRSVGLEGLNLPDRGSDPLEDVLIDERDRLVARAISSLDTDHRDVLVLRFYGGHSFQEIAAQLGIPLGTVKSRVFYAVKSCREILREKGVLE